MTEYVFKPSRRVNGKRVRSRCWVGRYSLGKGEPVVRVALGTPDEQVARKRLRAIIVSKQRQAEGLETSDAVVSTMGADIASLLREYRADLEARGLAARHVHDTVRRIENIVDGTGWVKLRDVTAAGFVQWRARKAASAKTLKEYQTSLAAFLNWLHRLGRIEKNPLSGVSPVEIRGKQVRPTRAFSEDELARLFEVSGPRADAYRVLAYTGQRKSEISRLTVDRLRVDGEAPHLRLDAAHTKDKDSRVVPLHPVALAAFRRVLAVRNAPEGESRVFFGRFPTYEAFAADLERAGIERADVSGRVVNFHAFRKTFQTLGAMYGVNQRSAQELLGHSDANLTAKVYTDVAALRLGVEIGKIPDVSERKAPSPLRAQIGAQVAQIRGLFEDFLQSVALGKMVVGTGFEPV